jgi:hypothetical protein
MPADTTALTRTLATTSPIVFQAELDAARSYAENEKAESTRQAYRTDFRLFGTWCGDRGLEPLPATPEAVAGYLAHLADSGAKASTISRKVAAIRYAHRLAGLESPTGAESLKAVMRGIRRTHGAAPVRKQPATHDLIADMLREVAAAETRRTG